MDVGGIGPTPIPQPATPATGLTDDSGMFMNLLLTQLKSQDPMSPADPNEFVSQLVQLNTLGELTKIRELVQSLTTATVQG